MSDTTYQILQIVEERCVITFLSNQACDFYLADDKTIIIYSPSYFNHPQHNNFFIQHTTKEDFFLNNRFFFIL